MKVRNVFYFLVVCVFTSMMALSQSDRESDNANADSRTMEDLNMKGGDAAMPPFTDSIINVESPFRQEFLSKGDAIRDVSPALHGQNALRALAPSESNV